MYNTRYMVEAPLEALSPARSDGVERQAVSINFSKSNSHKAKLLVYHGRVLVIINLTYNVSL